MRAQDIRFIQSDYGEKVLEWLKKNDQHYVSSSQPTAIEEWATDSSEEKGVRKVLYKGQLLIVREGKIYNAVGMRL